MLELDAGFADADGNLISDELTTVIRVALSELAGDATQMTITTTWASDEAMEQALATGMHAGMTAAVGQIDALLNPPAATGSAGWRARTPTSRFADLRLRNPSTTKRL